jgi:hypothetical protein
MGNSGQAVSISIDRGETKGIGSHSSREASKAGRSGNEKAPDGSGASISPEAPVGVEPTMMDLQSTALPLGYGAFEGQS